MHRIIIVTVFGLLIAPADSAAQAPRSGDADQRLRAIEEKVDRLGRDAPLRVVAYDPKALEQTTKLIQQARDTLGTQLERRQQDYLDFRLKNPHVLLPSAAGPTVYQAQLNALTAKLLDLRQRAAEVEARMALVGQTVKDAKDAAADREARALLMLLQRRGVDVAALRRGAADGRAEIGAADLLRLYADSLRLELKEIQLVTAATEEQREQTVKVTREMANYEAQDERYRQGIASTRKLFDSIVNRLQEINVVRDFGKP